MKRILSLVFLMALGACGGVTISPFGIPLTSSPSQSPGNGTTTGPAATTNDANFSQLLNGLRVDRGLGRVSYDSRLNAAAQLHAEDMAINNYFSHTSQDGRTALDRIMAQGYVPNAYGENIAGGQQSDQEVLTAWVNSPKHNEILNGEVFDDFALGVAGSGSRTRWVLLMGRESTASQ